jgi:hypothetical protein
MKICYMKIRTVHLASLLTLSLLCGNSVKADFMNWSYTTTPNVQGVSAGGAGGSSGGAVSLTDFNNQAGAASIPVIAVVTSSASTSPVTFNPANATYTLTMAITDNTTHDTGTLTFTGSVGGTLSATTSTLTNSFAPSPNTLTLDGHKYTVTIPTANLLTPTAPQQNIMATVSVSDVTGGGGNPPPPPPPTNNTPEPSSIVLACAAIGALGVRRLRQAMA